MSTDPNVLEPAQLPAPLAKAGHRARDLENSVEPHRAAEYRIGAADACADAQTLIRGMAGLPVEGDSLRA